MEIEAPLHKGKRDPFLKIVFSTRSKNLVLVPGNYTKNYFLNRTVSKINKNIENFEIVRPFYRVIHHPLNAVNKVEEDIDLYL